MNNSINTNNESGNSFVQASSFIKTPNGSLKRRKQKMYYKDIYLEKQNYVDTISERKQMSTKTLSSIEKEDKSKVRTIKIIGQVDIDNENKSYVMSFWNNCFKVEEYIYTCLSERSIILRINTTTNEIAFKKFDESDLGFVGVVEGVK